MKPLILLVLFATAVLAAPTGASAQSFPPPESDEAVRRAERGMLYLHPGGESFVTASLSQWKGYLIVATAGKQYKYLGSCRVAPSDMKKKYAMPDLQAFGEHEVWVLFINKKHNPGIGATIQRARAICQQP